MKRANFLIKLRKEGKLKLVEPSDNVASSYIQKSDNSLKSAKILLENNQMEDAVPIAYYSMYNMATALLFKVGIKCENHTGAIIILKDLFGIDNTKIKFAKTERVDKQYYVDFKITRKDAENIIQMAKEFNPVVYDFIEKLTSKQISEFRKDFEEALK